MSSVVRAPGVRSSRCHDHPALIRSQNPCRVGREWAAPRARFATAVSPRSIAIQNPPRVTPAPPKRKRPKRKTLVDNGEKDMAASLKPKIDEWVHVGRRNQDQ